MDYDNWLQRGFDDEPIDWEKVNDERASIMFDMELDKLR